MSVIDFIAVRRTKDEQASQVSTSYDGEHASPGPLTASQFKRVVKE